MFVTLEDRPLFSLAGIYDSWHCPQGGGPAMTFSIVTTEANPLMRHIDNANCRMPVILSPGDEERWLTPGLTDAHIAALLKPYPDRTMRSEPVPSDFA